MTTTAGSIMPIRSVDGALVGVREGPGDVSIRLHNLYREKRWAGWNATPMRYELPNQDECPGVLDRSRCMCSRLTLSLKRAAAKAMVSRPKRSGWKTGIAIVGLPLTGAEAYRIAIAEATIEGAETTDLEASS